MHRSHRVIGLLAIMLAAGCGGGAAQASPSPSAATAVNTCARAHQSAHLAYVVVQHLSGQAIERCAGFDGDAISAEMAMTATGIQLQSVGGTVCQIDHEPQQIGDCSAGQARWTLWLYSAGAWTAATAPYGTLLLHDHEALGWRYAASSEAAPPVTPRPL